MSQRTGYLKMLCPNCNEVIDRVEEVCMEVSEGLWSPVIIEEEGKTAFGGCRVTFLDRNVRCPKCKEVLLKRANHDRIVGLTHAMVENLKNMQTMKRRC